MLLSRRRFLLFCGASAPALFVGGSSFALPRRMVLHIGGSCSFCGKEAYAVQSLVGIGGQPVRICDECLGLCMDIISEELELRPPPLDVELEKALNALQPEQLAQTIERELTVRGHPRISLDCSFCGKNQHEVRKLIAGPTVYICDACIGDAVSLTTHVLRGSTPGR